MLHSSSTYSQSKFDKIRRKKPLFCCFIESGASRSSDDLGRRCCHRTADSGNLSMYICFEKNDNSDCPAFQPMFRYSLPSSLIQDMNQCLNDFQKDSAEDCAVQRSESSNSSIVNFYSIADTGIWTSWR